MARFALLLCAFVVLLPSATPARKRRHGAVFPETVNLASASRGATAWANGTCGGGGAAEAYCKPRGGCGLCHSARRDKAHPPEAAIDGDPNTWWQSSSLHEGLRFHQVTFTIDLKQVYQVLYIRVRAGPSPRPGNWILEKSVDGSSWSPWQFFAASWDECWARYGVKPSPASKARLLSDSEVLCTAAFSKPTPHESGEIHLPLTQGRPGYNTSSREFVEFTKARYVRLRLERMAGPKAERVRPGTEAAKRFFYTIKDLLIQGRCLCNGHASSCPYSESSKRFVCRCEHNTCGPECGECCPLHWQTDWRPGGRAGGKCSACECHGHATRCRYDPLVAASYLSVDAHGRFHGGGVCIDCQKHTAGINCETCEDGYYRPIGVRLDAEEPCFPCECHSVGSTGSCIKDDSEAHLGKTAGTCQCHEGFTGPKCNKCASGYKGFPDCRQCTCDPRGMLPGSSCDSGCSCKLNVEGEQCNQCKPGFYLLDVDNPDGCIPCYCSGVANNCTEASGYYLREVSTMDGWEVGDGWGNVVATPYRAEPGKNSLSVAQFQLAGATSCYWVAPPAFRGDLITSYGSSVTFSLSWDVMRGDTSGRPTIGPDLVLIGANGVRIGYGEARHKTKNMTITVTLSEEGWYFLLDNDSDGILRSRRNEMAQAEFRGPQVTRSQMLSVLSDVKHLMIRATFHTDQAETSLEMCTLETGVKEQFAGSAVNFLESCSCPEGYIGLSCQRCDFGYARINPDATSLKQNAVCSKCNCHGHAATCDPISGKCGACEHFTVGSMCDKCAEGYFGDATQGTSQDCKPCACPHHRSDHGFTPTCTIAPANSSAVYLCTSCPPGHTGDHCEKCDIGYYGNAMETGCHSCDCNDGPCDPITGQCLTCLGNTEGRRCDRCRPNHYGQPLATGCFACSCNGEGSVTIECDPEDGQCECRDKYAGRACDRCQTGLGNITAGCVPCSCDSPGAVSSLCDPVSAACICQPGVTGDRCDSCLPQHYDYSSIGCKKCKCHPVGSIHSECDVVSGQCSCQENVIGRTCDYCEDGFWGLSSGRCQECNCDPMGSDDNTCDQETGQCLCKSGVGGLKCDRCLPKYYGFSPFGCSECEACDLPGHICDPDTGQCVCPPRTIGVACSACDHNSWGFIPLVGCKACQCSPEGTLAGRQCDAINGKCPCRPGYGSQHCDSCLRGWYGFPSCRRCDCHPPGTQSQHCTAGICECDDTGQCPCKSSVVGKRCDNCRDGSFGLSGEDQHGCTQCFCFGRSTRCTSAGLVWSQVHMPRPRTLSVQYDEDSSPTATNSFPVNTQEICYINLAMPGMNKMVKKEGIPLNSTNNLRIIPGDDGDVELGVSYPFDAPVYWQLPRTFLGDKVLSYGGFLRFTVETEGESTQMPESILSSYPLIQIQGNDRLVLEHYPVIVNPTNNYQVRFHESLWKLKNNKESRVSRETLMIALQNIQHILIRASESIVFSVARLRDVTLDIAAEAEGIPFPNAYGIELCECPESYNATSCQDPSIGYFRRKQTNISSTIIIQLVGEAEPCHCNGRSNICDIESGHCIGCANHTGGPHCEVCADGHYGTPETGCLPCPCPSITNNFAKSCTVFPGQDPICHCKDGYTGPLCNSCKYGWFGYPRRPGGSCKPCGCDARGSVSDECHEEHGQCNCRPGVRGRNCSQCQDPRHVLAEHGCVPCNDACVSRLLDSISLLASRLEKAAVTVEAGLAAPPWERLAAAENDAAAAAALVAMVSGAAEDARALSLGEPARVAALHTRLKKLLRKGDTLDEQTNDLENETKDTAVLLDSTNKEIDQIMKRLTHYIDNDGELINKAAMILEAKQLLNRVRDRDLEPLKNESKRVLRICSNLFNELSYIVSEPNNVDNLKKKLLELLDKNENLLDILDSTDKTVEMIKLKNASFRNASTVIQSKFNSIIDIERSTRDILDETDILIKMSEVDITESEDSYDALVELKETLKRGQEAIRKKLMWISTQELREEYVNPAKEHARELVELTNSLDREFQADVGLAVKATMAYDEIIQSMQEAKKTVLEAKAAADDAYDQAYPPDFEESLVDQALQTKRDSENIQAEVIDQHTSLSAMKVELDHSFDHALEVADALDKIEMEQDMVVKQIEDLEKQSLDVKESAEGTVKRADELVEEAEALQDNVTYLMYNLETKLKPDMEIIVKESELSLNSAEEIVNEAQGNVRKTQQVIGTLLDNTKRYQSLFSQWNNSIADKLSELKDKITQARHMASSIRLSLTSIGDGAGGSCVRTYAPAHLEPTTMTSVMLTYAISSQLRDALLFYLPSSSTEDFVAIEMVNRKMRFVWNVGGGLGEVTHPLHIQTAGDLSKDQHWYKVEAERMGNVGRLWVRPVVVAEGSPLGSSPPATNSSAAGASRLDVGAGDRIWVGGADRARHPHLLSTQPGLVGCLHQLHLNSRPIGLWDFRTQNPLSCTACIEGAEEVKDETSYSFSGDGYVSLSHDATSVYNKYLFSISLAFRTFDHNALIFLAVDNEKKKYISLSLVDGHITFKIGYSQESSLEMTTLERYNNGNWTRVEASRYFDRKKQLEKGVLKVADEVRDGAPTRPPGQDAIPDLSQSEYYVGGVPPGAKITSAAPRPHPFLGCMADVQIAQQGYNLLKGRFWGVQAACPGRPIAVAGFFGNGYIELPSHQLKKKGGFSFVFSTSDRDALLLLSTFEGLTGSHDDKEEITNQIWQEDRLSYCSVSLRRGQVDVRLNAGKGEVRLASVSSEYADSKFHTVALIKHGRRVELRMDDNLDAATTLPEGGSAVKAPGDAGGLYLGGLPPGFNTTGRTYSSQPLRGTIKDLIYNDMIIGFDKPVRFEEAAIGRFGPESGGSDNSALSSRGATGCRKVPSYSVELNAVKFGDSPYSHVQINLRKRSIFQKNFTLELNFRTFYPYGLLFVIPGVRGKQPHYLMASLRNGRVVIVVKGRRKIETTGQAVFNDGIWHHMVLQKWDRKMVLKVDAIDPEKTKTPKKMNIGNIMFVGGIPESGVLLPNQLVSKLEGFKGCIRELKLNSREEDMVGDRATPDRVGQCFPNVEKGSYFPGDAYAIYKNKFDVGELVELELEFRTSEMNGILLSVSDPDGYPSLTLELYNGKVVLGGDMGDRRPYKVEVSFPSDFAFCDNRWHRVQALFVGDEITLKVDNVDTKYWLSDNGHLTEAHTFSPLFVGGLPEYAPSSTLMSRENFRGCIRGIVVNGERRDWTDMAAIHNILLSSCPLAS